VNCAVRVAIHCEPLDLHPASHAVVHLIAGFDDHREPSPVLLAKQVVLHHPHVARVVLAGIALQRGEDALPFLREGIHRPFVATQDGPHDLHQVVERALDLDREHVEFFIELLRVLPLRRRPRRRLLGQRGLILLIRLQVRPDREQLARQQDDEVDQIAAIRIDEVVVRGDVQRVQEDAIQNDRVRRLVLEQLRCLRARRQLWLHSRIVAGPARR
jgi:hypothetical protein